MVGNSVTEGIERAEEDRKKKAQEFRRELACFIACRGIPLTALESGVIGEMVGFIKREFAKWNKA